MNLVQMPEHQRLLLRVKCLNNLFNFAVAVMGYDDITPSLHGTYCNFLGSASQRKQATMPRGFVKTWIGSIAYPVWVTLSRTKEEEFPYAKAWEDKYWTLGPNMRVLIASYVISNAEKMLGLIRKTYESNPAMQMLFPEVIPQNFQKTKWSNESACIQRDTNFTESTFESAGIGGASTSRHYDLIIEDDLIYAKKDDFSGQELQPGQDDIDKAIGWHKLATSLLTPGKHTHIHNMGTRWAKHDLVDYIRRNEPSYELFTKGCVNLEELESKSHWSECTPEWKECYDVEQLRMIEAAQGHYMFSTQYLLKPIAPEEMLFKKHWLQYYISPEELPEVKRRFTTIDLAEWTDSSRKRGCNAVVLTCDWDSLNHCWLVHYDVGRFDPSQVIELMAKHWKLFSPEFIAVESVYYQKAIAHFAKKYMEEGKVPMMSIRQIVPEGNVAKEIRIRALEPLASNLAIHCKDTHKEFIEEFTDYVPNSNTCRKDILDALAYQLQIARPGIVAQKEREKPKGDIIVVQTLDKLLEELWAKSKHKDSFGHEEVPIDPFQDEDYGIPARSPFGEE